MRSLLLGLALALVTITGTASADTFRPLPTTPSNLPSSDVPNQPGQIALPPNWTAQPSQPAPLDFQQLELIWQSAGSAYGIPWQVLGAINKVESNFGSNMGPSSAGAIGWMQFMPDTWLRWGLDANGDGFASPWTAEDAIYAAARYLAASGGRTDISRAIFSYNHAQWYVDEVLGIAKTFGQSGLGGTFQLTQVQQSVDIARRHVAAISSRVAAAERVEARLARIAAKKQRGVATTTLISDEIVAQKAATQAAAHRDRAHARVEQLKAELRQAATKLNTARTQMQHAPAASAAPLSGSVYDAPAAPSGYVFPVGGGPSVVSVGHHHHDYPAADIAAPEGSPLYALSDAIVLRAWSTPDARCGIGMTIETSDHQSWTYCHMSYLEPSVSAGVALSAGAPVGLVGHTGDATGPHLHLQLNPQTSYPQQQPWFQWFAGRAFRWQDAPTPTPPPTTTGPPVFSVGPQTGDSAASTGVVRFTRVGG